MPPQRVLGLFAKWPDSGAVKTRLGRGPDWGARVARAFLLDTLLRLTNVDARRVLVFTPDSTEAMFADLAGDRFVLTPQGDGDLGARMAHFFEREFTLGAEAIVLVGADSPSLPIDYVVDAFDRLNRADVVLGPATDGGYYLIGCRHRLPPVFDGVAWSSAEVLAQTIARLSDPQWRVSLLPPWYDIDTPESWEMLRGHVAALRRAGEDPGLPSTEDLLHENTP
jgi:rSAM/selenodomain-associated transferase 1